MATIQEQVRLLIPDLGLEDEEIFTDDQINSFLEMVADNVFLATALALDVIATNETLTYKYVKTDDLVVDGVKGAVIIRQRAQEMRDSVLSEINDAFEIIYPRASAVQPEAAAWSYMP